MNKRYIYKLSNVVDIFTGGLLVESCKVLCYLHKLYTTAVVQRRRNKNPRDLKQRFKKLPVALTAFLLVATDSDVQISTSVW